MIGRMTIGRPVSVQGVGLHRGERVDLTLRPASPGSGLVFVRTDRDGDEIPVHQDYLSGTAYATTLAVNGTEAATVEHLLSAVVGLGIDDLRMELCGSEVPILDGSAAGFVDLLADAGRVESEVTRQVLRVEAPVTVRDGEKSITVEPGRGLRIRYAIDFKHPIIQDSERLFTLRPRSYAREIAPARTFCRLEEVEGLRRAGLARGGSLDNALVVDRDGLLNGPLRFRDEFVRHKILDLVGDLALLGLPLEGRVTAVRAGHALHARLVRELLERSEAWSLVPSTAVADPVPRTTPVAVPA
jgi:UDP-3-O-[3-hydroxymyristoyl] N-acetylglucosamine deacetylase